MADQTLTIALPDDGLDAIFGRFDENLRFIESSARVRLSTHGHDLLAEGDAASVARVERLFSQLVALQQEGYGLSNGDVRKAWDLLAQDPAVELRDFFLKASTRTSGRRQVTAKSINQKKYLDAIDRFDIVFGVGPARRTWLWRRPSPFCSRRR
jgi:phosphate starvation-inducible PhoH-like protein